MKLSNDVEKYEIEVTKMGQNYSFFFYSEATQSRLNQPQILCCVLTLQNPNVATAKLFD